MSTYQRLDISSGPEPTISGETPVSAPGRRDRGAGHPRPTCVVADAHGFAGRAPFARTRHLDAAERRYHRRAPRERARADVAPAQDGQGHAPTRRPRELTRLSGATRPSAAGRARSPCYSAPLRACPLRGVPPPPALQCPIRRRNRRQRRRPSPNAAATPRP